MAYEIQRQRYLYSPPEEDLAQRTPPPVKYNPAHDVESIFWILLWSLFARHQSQPARDYAASIFRDTTTEPIAARRDVLGTTDELRHQIFQCLPEANHDLQTPLRVFRKSLVDHYQSREPLSMPLETFTSLFRSSREALVGCREPAKAVRLQPLLRETPEAMEELVGGRAPRNKRKTQSRDDDAEFVDEGAERPAKLSRRSLPKQPCLEQRDSNTRSRSAKSDVVA